MNRPYTAEQYEAMVDRIRTKLPNAAISCDIIAGFPGETDEEFAESRALCERVGFSRMHVFRYSARPGTPAATAPGQVAPEVMAARSSELRHVAESTSQADARARIGAFETAVLEFGNRGTLGSFHRVIVDETDEEFAESRALCERVGFSRMHVFRYRARPGTPAATAPGQVAPEVMAARSSERRHVAESTSPADARARLGACETAVLEVGNRGTLGSFHRVIGDDAGTARTGQLVRVTITGLDDRGLLHASMGECDL